MKHPNKIPHHVAIIMDGNGRWAKKKGLPRIAGHRAGVKAAQEAIAAARDLGVGVLTLYTFSTENWQRPKREVEALFKLLGDYLDREEDKLNENNIRFSVIGRTEGLPQALREKLKDTVEATKDNTGLRLNLALNYGGRQEIIDAVRAIAKDLRDGELEAAKIDEDLFPRYLYTSDIPDPDLLIRTSGESRISNFLLWQISYTELYFTSKLWPDFKKSDFQKATAEYSMRERKFGR